MPTLAIRDLQEPAMQGTCGAGRRVLGSGSGRAAAFVVLFVAFASKLPLCEAAAQTPVETYYVNDGKNNTHDTALGEVSTDLMGWIPWSRYANTAPSGGHYFARAWLPTTPTFQDKMYELALDLDLLKQQVTSNCVFTPNPFPPLPPFTPAQVVPELPVIPVENVAWWIATSGVGAGAPRHVFYWPYKLNGASMMVCMAGDLTTSGAYVPVAGNPAHILVWNYASHLSRFGTNKNAWHDTGQSAAPVREFSMPQGLYAGPANNILSLKEQALEAGNIVVFCWENYGQDFWTSLQRTQEAEWFVRQQFSQGPPNASGGTYPSFTVGKTFLEGASWGQVVSGILALLQPKTYAGSGTWEISDIAYGIDEYAELSSHFNAFMGKGVGWLTTAD